MKLLRKLSVGLLTALISIFCFSFVSGAVSFDELNSSEVFLKQTQNDTCTLASAAMLVRRAAYASGNANWRSITEASLRSTAWVEGAGLRFSFTYSGISVSDGTMPEGSGNTTMLLSLLNDHPEGIVIYDYEIPHAILVTDYTNGQFYCADPARNVPSGRIPISSASVSVNNADAYWYVASPKVSVSGSPSSGGSNPGGSESNPGGSGETPGGSGSPSVSGMRTISRPGEIDALEVQDVGMLFHDALWNDYTTINVPERGWVILDTTHPAEPGVYANASLSKRIGSISQERLGGNMRRYAYYLEKGTYYVTPATYAIAPATLYAYFLPSSSILSATVSLSPDHSSATLHCESAMGSGTFYRWVKDTSTTNNIKNESFYSNHSVISDIDVTENGTYSIRSSTNAQEWKNYPVDIQVTVSGINPRPAVCDHNYKTVVDRKATCGQSGSQHLECTICGQKGASTTIPATGKHSYGSYTVTKRATAVSNGTKTRTCSVCGAKDNASIPKLEAMIKLNCKSLTLKVGQSTKSVKVSGLAEGDSVASWKSANTRIVKVKSNGKIIAQKQTGTTKVTVTLESGLKKSITVKVQKSAVRTTEISGLPGDVFLSKGEKITLKPTITPLTSQDKVTYKSSNKKVASVSSKGIVQGKKAGQAKITVKSGKKKFTVTVKVTG